jgi:hypothetical protein
MAIQDPPPLPLPEIIPTPSLRQRILGRLNPKRLLNHFAAKALEAADVVLGSIPIAEVAAEIKDVALIAIKD